ncbi:histone-lysine N-methyltransferase SMYD3 isoform X2 [Sphaerodactylus townsendi]|uniref:histone-lysine N-methyltransferase SMYD3 isoform X2 n=1 Tax=Sphaerodactylus townsendi TaxID=933632 RepID=UPI0020274D64|nr:histone-lysine N-methyltransferase SMYD3 isoform X2 [Sphaerodactylus townsendi]
MEVFPVRQRQWPASQTRESPAGAATVEPFAYCVTKKSLGDVCEHCLSRKERLLRCSQCKVARYCNIQCQKEAWQDHKQECKCIKNIDPNFPPDSVRLVGRIIFKLLRQSTCPSEELYSFSDLQSNFEKLSEEMKEGLGYLTKALQLYLKAEIQDASQLPPGLDVFQTFAKVLLMDLEWKKIKPLILEVTCNCFSISNGEVQDVGVGLYPSMSLLNNSCDPNCVIVFEGRQLYLHSVREIQIGEELTISYTDTMMPSTERRQQLKRQYCFECNCHMCHTHSRDADLLAGNEQAWKEVKEAINKMTTPKSQEEWKLALVKCQTLLKNTSTLLPDTNIYQLKLLDLAMDACINLGLLEEALLYGNRTLEPFRFYYSGFHPLRAVQLMRVAKLQYSQDMFPQALETLKQAYDIMKVTHGAEHSLVQNLMMLKEDCEAGKTAKSGFQIG